MTLRTAEENRHSLLGRLKYRFEQKQYSPLAVPTSKNLLKVFNILKRKHMSIDTFDDNGNRIKVEQIGFTHSNSWHTKGVHVAIRQKLPEDVVNGEKYLSIIMSRDEKDDISINTCVVRPATTEDELMEFGDYIRIGDLRIDYIHPNGKFERGVVDGNGPDLGLPTGEWFIDGVSYDNSLTRAYLLLVNTLFGVGVVPPLGSRNNMNTMKLIAG